MEKITSDNLKDPEANADWIKKVNDGKYQKADIAAGKAALANYLKKKKS